MSAERVVVTRTELRRILALIEDAAATIRAMLERPEPRPPEGDERGWPLLNPDEPYHPRD